MEQLIELFIYSLNSKRTPSPTQCTHQLGDIKNKKKGVTCGWNMLTTHCGIRSSKSSIDRAQFRQREEFPQGHSFSSCYYLSATLNGLNLKVS